MKRLPRPSLALLVLAALLGATETTGSVPTSRPSGPPCAIGPVTGAPIAGPGTAGEGSEECTIAILTGKTTRDGRPILWKNRDAAYVDNEVILFQDGYRSLALVNAGETDKAWIGLNERGFAILNALTYNIPDTVAGGITNGELMKTALGRCASVDEFETYLRETNKTGRDNPANLAVIDAAGGAAIFEVAGRDYIRFDVRNESAGFIVRTNFSLSGDTSYVETWRYNRCRRLVKRAIASGGADVATMLQTVARDLCASNCDPYPLPFQGSPPGYPKNHGYVETTSTINRRTSVSGGAVVGVLRGEDPLLSTFYPVVGPPVVTIPLPVWVAAGATPAELNGPATSPLCDLAKERSRLCYDDPAHPQLLNTYRLVNPERAGFLTRAERIERWLLPEADLRLARWRRTGVIPEEMALAEADIARRAFEQYQADPQPSSREAPVALRLAGPNPSSGSVEIHYEAAGTLPAGWSVVVFGPTGRRVTNIRGVDALPGRGTILWDGRDDRGEPVSSGVYFLKPSWPADAPGTKAVLIR